MAKSKGGWGRSPFSERSECRQPWHTRILPRINRTKNGLLLLDNATRSSGWTTSLCCWDMVDPIELMIIDDEIDWVTVNGIGPGEWSIWEEVAEGPPPTLPEEKAPKELKSISWMKGIRWSSTTDTSWDNTRWSQWSNTSCMKGTQGSHWRSTTDTSWVKGTERHCWRYTLISWVKDEGRSYWRSTTDGLSTEGDCSSYLSLVGESSDSSLQNL